MLQREVALTLGVNKMAITGWERGWWEPRISKLPRIIAFLGYTPALGQGLDTLAGRVKAYRLAHGLSQEGLAKLLGVNESTIFHWEQGHRTPSEKLTKMLLKIGL
jgi:transcriptional regulator with XRE-family HTH domain